MAKRYYDTFVIQLNYIAIIALFDEQFNLIIL